MLSKSQNGKRKSAMEKKSFEVIMVENILKLIKQIDIQIQVTHPNFKWKNSNKSTCGYIIIKLLKTKITKRSLNQRILMYSYGETKTQMTANFSSQTMEARRHL